MNPIAPSLFREITLAVLGATTALVSLAVAQSPAQPPSVVSETSSIRGQVKNAASGAYLNRVRVSIVGTDIVEYTDATGSYRIANAPSGRVEMEVYYTQLEPARVQVDLPPNGHVERNVSLEARDAKAAEKNTVQLEKFVITAKHESDIEALAVNEQRFAPNIKNVVSTEAFGEVVGGTMGDFLKFIPGVAVEYAGNTVTKASVRGIGHGMTALTTDGVPMVSTTTDPNVSNARSFDMGMTDSTDLSRIEVSKVPTPSTPADSIGGSINMVTKSAFDRDRAQLRYSIGLLGNSYGLSLRKTPDSWEDKMTYKVWPLLALDYTVPITKNFGLMFSGLAKKQAEPAHTTNATKIFSIAGAGTGASLSKPFLSGFRKLGGARSAEQYSLFTKADWRITPNAVVSLAVKWSYRDRLIGDGAMQFNTGTVGTHGPALLDV